MALHQTEQHNRQAHVFCSALVLHHIAVYVPHSSIAAMLEWGTNTTCNRWFPGIETIDDVFAQLLAGWVV